MAKELIPRSESGSWYNGPFSTIHEFHSFQVGMSMGLSGNNKVLGVLVLLYTTGKGPKILREIWYLSAGFIIGKILKYRMEG